jgi:hypothetical protein
MNLSLCLERCNPCGADLPAFPLFQAVNAGPLKVMIAGAPAAGKGTQCAKIVDKAGEAASCARRHSTSGQGNATFTLR